MMTSIEDQIDRFRKNMIGERRSPYTVKEYSFLSSIFLKFVNKDLDQCTPADIENFKLYLAVERKYSKSSQYLAIKAVKHLFKSRNIKPPENLIAPRRSAKMPVYLSQSEMERLVEASREDLRDRAMILLLLYTGMRVGELCSLKPEDIDTTEGLIRVRSGKGDKDRIVLIPPECSEVLSQLYSGKIKSGKFSEYFFGTRNGKIHPTTVERIVRNNAKKCGIERKVTPHTLRHTFATTVLKNGGDIRFIQQILGHASIATTQIYTHIDSSTLRDMYSKYRPKI